MSLNKFVNVPPEKPFHSNQYAEAARHGRIGSTNSQTFSQRTRIDKNRQAISRYHTSMVARGNQQHRARPGLVDVVKQPTSREVPQAPRTSAQKPVSPRRSFSEPSGRGYNPYG